MSGEFEYTGNEVHFYVSSSSASADIFVDDIILRKLGGTINPTDTDMDGMLDTLELTYFGDLNQSATSDYDNDGVSNVLELRSGTNPNDANSYFKVLANQFNHGLTQDSIAWAGNSGKNYTILGTDNLQGAWEILTEAQSGSLGLDLGVGDGSAYHQWSGMHSDAAQKFYRVILDD